MIKGEEKRRAKWKIGIVKELYRGNDQEIRSVQIKTAKGCLEQLIQLLYSLELHCNEITSDDAVPRTEEASSNGDIQSKHGELNVNATEFRPERTAVIIGSIKMSHIVANEIDGE